MRFPDLAERAIAFLERAEGGQTAEGIAAHLLGDAAARLAPVVEVVSQSLAADTRLRRDLGGAWGLASWDAAEPPLKDEVFVVVDVETTGGRSERHRIVEVAALKVRGGRLCGQFCSLVNPGAPLRQFVTAFTGITQEMADEAPPAAEVLVALRDFLGDAVIVGHNVASDLSFLNYEAVWHGLPPFGNPALDTQELARRLLGERHRLDLSGVSKALGLQPPPRHRALPDARLALDVLLALLARVDAREARTFSELQAWLSSPLIDRQARVRRVRSVLPTHALRALPDLPGVYTFRDEAGQALYVGKAVSLRERVARHFTGTGRAMRLDEGLLDRTAAVDHQVVDTELDALLLEARLIRELRPPYNVQQSSRRGCPYVQVVRGAFPRLAAATAIRGHPSDYVGPYRTTQAVRHTIRTVQRVFQIRACRRTLPATRRAMRVPCLRLGQHYCPAPCADLVTPEQYETLVELARLFLVAGKEATLAALDERIRALATGGCDDEWQVAMLRECRARLRRIRRTYRPLEGGLAGEALVMAYPAPGGGLSLYLVRDGQHVRRASIPAVCTDMPALEEALRAWQQPSSHDPVSVAGETNQTDVDILLRWIYRHAGSPNLIPWPADRTIDDVIAAVRAVADIDSGWSGLDAESTPLAPFPPTERRPEGETPESAGL